MLVVLDVGWRMVLVISFVGITNAPVGRRNDQIVIGVLQVLVECHVGFPGDALLAPCVVIAFVGTKALGGSNRIVEDGVGDQSTGVDLTDYFLAVFIYLLGGQRGTVGVVEGRGAHCLSQ